MKTCIKCGEEKARSEFDADRNVCKVCRYEQKKRALEKRGKIRYSISDYTKTCPKCATERPNSLFYINSGRRTGLTDYCIPCHKIKAQEAYKRNPEKAIRRSEYRYDKIRGTPEHRAYIRKTNLRRMSEPMYVLTKRLRNRLYYALKDRPWKKGTHFSEYIGCTQEELVKHIEGQFVEGMSWENRSEWHIDHIMPLSSAKDEQELYRLCHYSNLRPMWARDNIRKGNKKPS